MDYPHAFPSVGLLHIRGYLHPQIAEAEIWNGELPLEHPFRILKRVFGLIKLRYRGLRKNHEWLCAAFALVNLYQHRNRLAPQGA